MIVENFKLYLILSLVSLSTNGQKVEVLSKLVSDVIENESGSAVLWAKICWSKINEFYFLINSSFPIQFGISINLPIDGSINKQWFFIDMHCECSSIFLSKIDERYFGHPYRWIIADATNDSIQHLAFLPGSNIILANYDSNSNQYILKQGT